MARLEAEHVECVSTYVSGGEIMRDNEDVAQHLVVQTGAFCGFDDGFAITAECGDSGTCGVAMDRRQIDELIERLIEFRDCAPGEDSIESSDA